MVDFDNGWTPLRGRDKYNDLNTALDDALNEYWADDSNLEKIEQICLISYRFMKYINNEFIGIHSRKEEKVPELFDAITNFYSVDDQSYQNMIDALELLSRAAYHHIKNEKKQQEKLDYHHDIM